MEASAKPSTVIDGQFLANTIHELRTPIQTISGSLELLNETKLNSEQKDYIHQIRFSSDVLLTLVNDLLDFSKISSGKFTIESIPLNPVEITEKTVELLSAEAHNRQLEIITDIDYTIPTSVLGDPTRIKQVLLNLIKNAIKFTHTGYIHVKLSQRLHNSILLFEVHDTGIGISKDRQSEIFTDFYQVDASITRKYGGTGLGLSISKSLVLAMNGKIGMKSEENMGSLFWFSIPLLVDKNFSPRSHMEDRIKLVSQIDIPEDTSILIIDNQTIALKSLYSKLKTLKFSKLETATSGTKALKKMKRAVANEKPYTIAFINMTMDDMDAWELAEQIRKNPTLNKTKCFLMIPDGKMDSALKEKTHAYFESYIYKPIKFKSLTEIFSNYFNVPQEFGIIDSVEEVPGKQSKTGKKSQLFAENKKIIIAEDHPINQKLMQTFVSHYGANAIVASNGQEVIDYIVKDLTVDIIFMDIHMPIKSGLEATKEIRELGYKGPIVACTANNDIDDFKTYEKAGMNDVLTKPFKRKDVGAILSKLIINKLTDAEAKNSASTVIKTLLGKTETKDFWDWNDFMDTVGGDIALGKELIMQYITQTDQFIALADEAQKESDFVSLISIGHTLKGSSATLSLENLAKIGSAIERAGKNKDMQTITMGIRTFKEIFNNFKLFVEP